MSFRSSVAVLGLFLAMFWVFGLMLALDRAKVDESLVMPTLKASERYDIDTVVVARTGKDKEPEEFRFTRKGEAWNLHQGNQSIKVESFRIRDLIKEIREARRDDDAGVPSEAGVTRPQVTVTLTGTKKAKDVPAAGDKAKDDKGAPKDVTKDAAKDSAQREWKLLVGNDSVDKKYVYVATSDRPGRVFPVLRSNLAGLFFKSANDLRSKRLFDFSEPTVQAVVLKDGGEFEVRKESAGAWMISRPNLGFADYEGPPAPKDAPPGARTPEGGVKGLINAIANIRVDTEDDFVPPAPDNLKRFGLETGKEAMRVQVLSGDAKNPTEETLLVGDAVKDYRYARLATDEGVFKVKSSYFQPVRAAIAEPAKYRSVDLAPIAIKDADTLTLRHGQEEARLFHQGEPKNWKIEFEREPRSAARGKAVETLLETLEGKRAIQRYRDVAETEAAKLDKELGFESPTAKVTLYLKGLEASKDDKNKEPTLMKDAKADIVWEFGKVENDQVAVRRTQADGKVARFDISRSVLEKIAPREGLLAYVEPVLPKRDPADVVRLALERDGNPLVLEKTKDHWEVREGSQIREGIRADANKAQAAVRAFAELQVHRWVKKLGAKENLEPFGLDKPGATISLTVRKNQLDPQALGSALGLLGGVTPSPVLVALGGIVGNQQGDTGEKVVIKFGKESKDEPGNVYVQHSASDRLALVPQTMVKTLQTTDFRDRSIILYPQVQIDVAAVGAVAGQSWSGLVAASPVVTGRWAGGDVDKVQSLNVTVRNPIELRTFNFVRKGKSWVDQSGLKEFQLDEDRVTRVADLAIAPRVQRLVRVTGGAKADQKLTDGEATLKVEAVLEGGARVTLTVGSDFEGQGFFAESSTWPGAIFLLPGDQVEPMLAGATFFAKPRVARAP